MARARSQKNALYQNWYSFVGNHFIDCSTYSLSCFEWSWYFVKKAPDIRKRNLMIGLFIVSFVAVALQTPTVTKKTSSAQSETKQTVTSTSSTASTTDTSSSIEEAKRIEDEKKLKKKQKKRELPKKKLQMSCKRKVKP